MVLYIGDQRVCPVIKAGEINNQDKTIIENGQYTADVGYTGLGTVTVNVPSDTFFGFIIENPSQSEVYSEQSSILKSVRIKTISTDFNNSFSSLAQIKPSKIDFNSIETITSYRCFYQAFLNLSELLNAEFKNLKTVSGQECFLYAIRNCGKIKNVYFDSLDSINAQNIFFRMFQDSAVENVYFNSLRTTSFGSYINQFQDIMYGTGTSKTHTIHFPSNLESTIQGLTGYPLFGGSSGSVVLAFDLPATE